jgi:hypothetical protein
MQSSPINHLKIFHTDFKLLFQLMLDSIKSPLLIILIIYTIILLIRSFHLAAVRMSIRKMYLGSKFSHLEHLSTEGRFQTMLLITYLK